MPQQFQEQWVNNLKDLKLLDKDKPAVQYFQNEQGTLNREFQILDLDDENLIIN